MLKHVRESTKSLLFLILLGTSCLLESDEFWYTGPSWNYPVLKKGSKISVHAIWSNRVEYFAQQLVNEGTIFPTVKCVGDLEMLGRVKSISPNTIIIGRVCHPLEGVGYNLLKSYEGNLRALAEQVMSYTIQAAKKYPFVDYWEPTNESDFNDEVPGDGKGVEGYRLFALLHFHFMDIAEEEGFKIALFTFCAGTPEYDEMKAIVETGVFGRAKQGGHILAWHEGVFTKDDPIDKWYPCTLPGAPEPCSDCGCLSLRYRWLYKFFLIPRNEVIPLFVSEFYEGNSPADKVVARMGWYDAEARKDYYHWGFAPFTIGPSPGWEGQDYEYAYPALIQYMISEKDKNNALPIEDAAPPPTPTLLSPANDSVITSLPIIFDWSDVSDSLSPPVMYQLQISTDPNFAIIRLSSNTFNSQCVVNNLLSGTYYWRVCAKDNAGNRSNWSEGRKIIVSVSNVDIMPPEAPKLHSPDNYATLTSLSIVFKWYEVIDESLPITYELQVDNNSSFESPVISLYNLQGTTCTVKINNNGLYYWRVRAKDGSGNVSEWSFPRSFTVDVENVPIVIEIKNSSFESELNNWVQNPTDGSATYSVDTLVKHTGSKAVKITSTAPSTKPHIWQASNENSIIPGKSYKFWVWVKTNNVAKTTSSPEDGVGIRLLWANNFFSQIYNTNYIEGPTGTTNGWVKISTTVVAPQNAQRVQVALFLRNATGTAWFDDVNEYEEITIDTTPPPAPRLLYPENGANVSPNAIITFRWNSIEDEQSNPCRYHLQVDNNQDFSSPELNIELTTLYHTLTLQNTFVPGETYFWRVRAVDNVGNAGDWSETRSFKIISENNVGVEEEIKKNDVRFSNFIVAKQSNNNVHLYYDIATPCKVSIEVFGLAGELVERFNIGYKEKGRYFVNWNIKDVPSGIYIVKFNLEAVNGRVIEQQKKKIFILR